MPEPLNHSGRTLHEELRSLEEWLRTLLANEGVALSWKQVAVYECDFSTGGKLDWQPGHERALEELNPSRFTEILASAPRGWVNLSAVTISNDTLIVRIEWFSEPSDPDQSRVRDRPVSVNRSGFNRRTIENLTAPAG